MVKKQKDDVPNPNSVANRDVIQRLNFLYQASVFMRSLSPTDDALLLTPETTSADGAELSAKLLPELKSSRRKRRKLDTSELSRSYLKDMKQVGQKALVRMFVLFRNPVC
jgi:ribonuclease P protein subunit RPR2